MRVSKAAALLAARVFLGLSPLVGGVHRLGHRGGAAWYLANVARVPGSSPALVWATGLFEILAGIALLVGWRTRTAAASLAGYSLLVAWFLHACVGHAAADPVVRDQEITHALRQVAVAGGLLALAVAGPGPHSLDRR